MSPKAPAVPSFGYVAGWAGGAPEAVQGIKASTGRIQRATSAVLKTFDVEAITVGADQSANLEVVIAREEQTRASAERSIGRGHVPPRW